MARFAASGESAAALADATIFAHLQPSATVGARIRRITLGARKTDGSAIASTQVQVQVHRATNASTTPGGYKAGFTLDAPLRTVTGTSSMTGGGIATTWATPPTTTATPLFTLNFNSQSGIDFPFEGLEEFSLTHATTDGLVLKHNSGAALAALTVVTFSVEWEE